MSSPYHILPPEQRRWWNRNVGQPPKYRMIWVDRVAVLWGVIVLMLMLLISDWAYATPINAVWALVVTVGPPWIILSVFNWVIRGPSRRIPPY